MEQQQPICDDRLKRKIQNRLAQRRFRNRKKASEAAVISLPEFLNGPFQTSDIVHSLNIEGPTTDKVMPIDLDNWEFEHDTEVENDAEVADISSGPSSDRFVFSPSKGSLDLAECSSDTTNVWSTDFLSDLSSMEEEGLAQISPEALGLQHDIDVTMHCLANPAQHISNSDDRVDSAQGAFMALFQPDSATVDSSRTQALSPAKNNPRPTGCCVAHKAEMMVSEIEELCRFGQRFGVLRINGDEVYHWLGEVKERLHEAIQCSFPSAGDSNDAASS